MAKKSISKRKKKPTVKRKAVRKLAKKPSRKVAKRRKVAKPRKVAKRRKKASAIPKGYHSITPYLVMDEAANAIEFYKKAFGAKGALVMKQPNGKVGHAELKIGDSKIMLADECPEMDARSPRSFGGSPMTIHLYVTKVDTVVDRAVSAGAKVVRPLENMFYGDRTATLLDPFGYKWHVSTHVEDVTMGELKKRAAKLFGNK